MKKILPHLGGKEWLGGGCVFGAALRMIRRRLLKENPEIWWGNNCEGKRVINNGATKEWPQNKKEESLLKLYLKNNALGLIFNFLTF